MPSASPPSRLHSGRCARTCGLLDASRRTSLDMIFPEDVQSDNPGEYCSCCFIRYRLRVIERDLHTRDAAGA
jgi:hypothetical protein